MYKITPFEKERCNLVQITPKSLHLTNWKLWSINSYWHKANGGIENNRIPYLPVTTHAYFLLYQGLHKMVYIMDRPHPAKAGDAFLKIKFHPITQLSKQPLLKLSTVINMVWNLTNHVGNGYLNIITEYLCISYFSPLILMTSKSIIYSKMDPSEISWRKTLVAGSIAIIYPFEFHML